MIYTEAAGDEYGQLQGTRISSPDDADSSLPHLSIIAALSSSGNLPGAAVAIFFSGPRVHVISLLGEMMAWHKDRSSSSSISSSISSRPILVVVCFFYDGKP